MPPKIKIHGFAKLYNAFNERGILAHIRPTAWKVLCALLSATRTRTGTCYPTVETLSRWSGISKNRISAETEYLARHSLIRKENFQLHGKPRILYWVSEPWFQNFPDFTSGCKVCAATSGKSAYIRDPVTGKLAGRTRTATIPDVREPRLPDDREPHMNTDYRGTNQKEPDEENPSRRETARQPNGESRIVHAPSLLAASPNHRSRADRLQQLSTLLSEGGHDLPDRIMLARKAGYTVQEVTNALGGSPRPSTMPTGQKGTAE
jgi:hypothetical protein